MNDSELLAPFWDHAEEFRKTLLWILSIAVCGILISFAFHKPLIHTLIQPLQEGNRPIIEQPLQKIRVVNTKKTPLLYSLSQETYFEDSTPGTVFISPHTLLISAEGSAIVSKPKIEGNLYLLGPLEGIFIAVKLSLWVGVIGSAPFWVFFVIRFIYPGLYQAEKQMILPFLLLSFGFICAGIILAYYCVIPVANAYLSHFNQNIGNNFWTLSNYLNYTFFLMLANAVAFELAAVGFFLVHRGFITAELLIEKRRHIYVASFFLAAILTPPDILTQLILALILILFFESLVLYARFKRTILYAHK